MGQYYYTIKTEGPDNENVVRRHNMALNNYLKYGWGDEKLLIDTVPLEKEKSVKHQSSSSTVKNNNLILITILCCDDDYDSE